MSTPAASGNVANTETAAKTTRTANSRQWVPAGTDRDLRRDDRAENVWHPGYAASDYSGGAWRIAVPSRRRAPCPAMSRTVLMGADSDGVEQTDSIFPSRKFR